MDLLFLPVLLFLFFVTSININEMGKLYMCRKLLVYASLLFKPNYKIHVMRDTIAMFHHHYKCK